MTPTRMSAEEKAEAYAPGMQLVQRDWLAGHKEGLKDALSSSEVMALFVGLQFFLAYTTPEDCLHPHVHASEAIQRFLALKEGK